MKLMSCSFASAVGVALIVLWSGGVHATGTPGAPSHLRTAPRAPSAPVHRTAPVARVAPDAPARTCHRAVQQQPRPPRPQFETRADVVLVDVTVVSGNGEPVEGLTAADFQLTINGQVRDVNTVQFISSRTTTSVVGAGAARGCQQQRSANRRGACCSSSSTRTTSGSARARTVLRAAERVMERLLPGDLVGLARLPTGRGGVEFTTDRSRIRRALSGNDGPAAAAADRARAPQRGRGLRAERSERCGRRSSSASAAAAACLAPAAAASRWKRACTSSRRRPRTCINDASTRTRVSINAFEDLTKRLATVNAPVNIVLISEGLFIGRDRNDLGNLARLAAQARVSFFVVQPDESMFDMDTPKIVGSVRDDSVVSEGLEQLAGYTRGTYFKVGHVRRRRLRTDRPRAVGLLPALVRADRGRSQLRRTAASRSRSSAAA